MHHQLAASSPFDAIVVGDASVVASGWQWHKISMIPFIECICHCNNNEFLLQMEYQRVE
jgi:hypothetical protein